MEEYLRTCTKHIMLLMEGQLPMKPWMGDSPSYATNEEINTSMLQGKGKEKIVAESSIKKRKSSDNANDIDKEFMGMMRNMSSELVEGFQMLANGMGLGFDVAKAHNDVYEALGEFESPKVQEKVSVGFLSAKDAGMLGCFNISSASRPKGDWSWSDDTTPESNLCWDGTIF